MIILKLKCVLHATVITFIMLLSCFHDVPFDLSPQNAIFKANLMYLVSSTFFKPSFLEI